MFETFNGLPLHPLAVHGAVVLIPLTAVGTWLIAARERWRTTLGWWVVALAGIAFVASVVSKESGEALARVVGEPEEHAALGDTLPLFAAALFAADLALMLAHTWARFSRDELPISASATTRTVEAQRRTRLVVITLAVVASLLAMFAVVQTVRVGDTGAQAVWGSVGQTR